MGRTGRNPQQIRPASWFSQWSNYKPVQTKAFWHTRVWSEGHSLQGPSRLVSILSESLDVSWREEVSIIRIIATKLSLETGVGKGAKGARAHSVQGLQCDSVCLWTSVSRPPHLNVLCSSKSSTRVKVDGPWKSEPCQPFKGPIPNELLGGTVFPR